ncbi:hypothetical protein AAZX31_20G029500 [Glycine max]
MEFSFPLLFFLLLPTLISAFSHESLVSLPFFLLLFSSGSHLDRMGRTQPNFRLRPQLIHKGHKIEAYVKSMESKNWLAQLKQGQTYIVQNFEVESNTGQYRTTNHQYRIFQTYLIILIILLDLSQLSIKLFMLII